MISLARQVLSSPRPFAVAIYCKSEDARRFLPYLRRGDKVVSVALKNRAHRLYFYEYQLGRRLLRENTVLFHATHYVCPPAHPGYRIITTFHDLGFALYPQFYPRIKRLYFALRFPEFLKRSSLIVAVSRSTAEGLRRRYPKAGRPVRVVYPGVDHLVLSETGPDRVTPRRHPFLLMVNSVERRKNIPFLIQVFNELKRRRRIPHHLVIVGLPGNDISALKKEISRSSFKQHIHYFPRISAAGLCSLYQQAACFLNASEYEGFGFTPFEALRFGCPAVLYSNGVISELLPNYPGLVSGFQIEEWVAAVGRQLQRQRSHLLAYPVIESLTWEETARQMIQIYSELMPIGEVAVAP